SIDVVPPVDGLAVDTHLTPAQAPRYLIASNGVDDSLRLFDPMPEPPRFVGSFRVRAEEGGIAAPAEGLALSTEPVGQLFPEGLLIVTSGANGTRRGALVSW